jgi:hypothetical protein
MASLEKSIHQAKAKEEMNKEPYFFFVCVLAVLGFELRALPLLV